MKLSRTNFNDFWDIFSETTCRFRTQTPKSSLTPCFTCAKYLLKVSIIIIQPNAIIWKYFTRRGKWIMWRKIPCFNIPLFKNIHVVGFGPWKTFPKYENSIYFHKAILKLLQGLHRTESEKHSPNLAEGQFFHIFTICLKRDTATNNFKQHKDFFFFSFF